MTLVKFGNKPANGFNLLDNFFNEFPTLFRSEFSSNMKDFAPVNVKEYKDAYQLELIAPGFEKNDFKINVENNILTVSVDKTNEVKNDDGSENGEKQIRREYSYRSFKRSFTLDDDIDAEKIEAKYVNGVLTLNLSKKAEVKASAKEIAVQ